MNTAMLIAFQASLDMITIEADLNILYFPVKCLLEFAETVTAPAAIKSYREN